MSFELSNSMLTSWLFRSAFGSSSFDFPCYLNCHSSFRFLFDDDAAIETAFDAAVPVTTTTTKVTNLHYSFDSRFLPDYFAAVADDDSSSRFAWDHSRQILFSTYHSVDLLNN